MALDLARLRAVARGEAYTETGVSGVTALQIAPVTPSVTPKTPSVTPVTPVTTKNHKVGNRCDLGFGTGVTEGVAATPILPDVTKETVVVYDRVALHREADRRNAAARRSKITDRWCTCGIMATLAVCAFRAEKGDAGARWVCMECFERRAET